MSDKKITELDELLALDTADVLPIVDDPAGTPETKKVQVGTLDDRYFDTDNHVDGTTNKVYTATEKTKLAGIEAAADVTDAGNVGSTIHAATGKTTPVDADEIALIDSAASNVLKKLTWANLKATAKTYFDTLYQAISAELAAIAGLTPTNDDIIQRKAGAWINRTMAQLKTDLVLAKGDVGLGNVSNVDQIPLSYLDTDTTLAANSDAKVASQKAIKTYVDAIAQGLDIKASVRAATTANITLSGAQTIDGVSVIAGDRVLVKDQSTGADNGIYVAASGAWARSSDANASAEVTAGMFVFVSEGTTNGNNGFALTTDDPITLGSTSLTFTQFSGAGQITAGAALTKTGNQLDVAVDDTTIEVNSDALRLKDNGVSLSKMAQMATASFLGRNTAGTGNVEVLSASTVRTILALVIGTNVQAYDADLDAIAALSPTNDDIIQRKSGAWTNRTMAQLKADIPASDTTTGVVELATAAETTTGTDAARAITPDGLAGSEPGKRVVQLPVFNWTTDVATGDGAYYFVAPSIINGMNLVAVHARVITAGTTGTTDIQIANVTDSVDVLSTKLTIDSTETGSETAATPAVINTSNDDIATNDLWRIDVDATATTKAKGLIVTLTFQTP